MTTLGSQRSGCACRDTGSSQQTTMCSSLGTCGPTEANHGSKTECLESSAWKMGASGGIAMAGREPPSRGGAQAGKRFHEPESLGLEGTWEEVRPGGYIAEEHVKDMDLDGIDRSILYPTVALFMYSMPDGELMTSVFRDLQRLDSGVLPGLVRTPERESPCSTSTTWARASASWSDALT